MDHTTDIDSGTLGAVPGQFIAQGAQGLPEPTTALAERISVVVDADWAGIVRIDYVRQKMRHGRHSHWAWVAVRAEQEQLPPISAAHAP